MNRLSRRNTSRDFKKSNVMTPLNWMTGVAEFILVPSGGYFRDSIFGWILLAVAIGILIFYGYLYNYFAKNDPDRLQTEEYNLRAQELALVLTNVESSQPIIVNSDEKLITQKE